MGWSGWGRCRGIGNGEAIAICIKISEMQERFGKMSVACEDSITLLQERRTALISAAVTGKIDVRHFAAMPA